MVTTIIAIYGAAVATLSLGLSAWIYVSSGPKVQAMALFLRSVEEDPDGWEIWLQVWNTGRQSIKVEIRELRLNNPTVSEEFRFTLLKWRGPELPMMLDAHSGERWIGKLPDQIHNSAGITPFRNYLGPAGRKPDKQTELCLILEVGGRRNVKVPLEDFADYYQRTRVQRQTR